jgi:hypothetical protein
MPTDIASQFWILKMPYLSQPVSVRKHPSCSTNNAAAVYDGRCWKRTSICLPLDDDQVTIANQTIAGPGIGRAVREALLREVERIYSENGLHAFENTKNAASLHEAGHAVVATWLGRPITKLTIKRGPLGWCGFTHWSDDGWTIQSDDGNAREMLLDHARNLYAGFAAERLFDKDFREGSSLDEIVMSQVSTAMVAGDDDPQGLWGSAVHTPVCRHLTRNERTVRRIADYLFAHRKMEGRPLEAVLADVVR